MNQAIIIADIYKVLSLVAILWYTLVRYCYYYCHNSYNEVTTQSFCPCLFSHAIKFSVNLNSSLWSNSNKSSNLGIRFFESLSLNLKSVLLLLYKTVLDILTWDRNIYTVQSNPVMGVYVHSGMYLPFQYNHIMSMTDH